MDARGSWNRLKLRQLESLPYEIWYGYIFINYAAAKFVSKLLVCLANEINYILDLILFVSLYILHFYTLLNQASKHCRPFRYFSLSFYRVFNSRTPVCTHTHTHAFPALVSSFLYFRLECRKFIMKCSLCWGLIRRISNIFSLPRASTPMYRLSVCENE